MVPPHPPARRARLRHARGVRAGLLRCSTGPTTRGVLTPEDGMKPGTVHCDVVWGGGKRRGEPLLRQMRPVSWAHMATSTRFRAPSFRMRLARWALTVLGVM